VHNFGADYDRTLMAWNENFQVSRMELAKVLGERFGRMWEYYLLQNAAAFRCRHISVANWFYRRKAFAAATRPSGSRRVLGMMAVSAEVPVTIVFMDRRTFVVVFLS